MSPELREKSQKNALKKVALFLSRTYLGVSKKRKTKIFHLASWEILAHQVYVVILLQWDFGSSVFSTKVLVILVESEGF